MSIVSINIKDIPFVLRNSEVYENLDKEENNEFIEIDSKFILTDLKIDSINDFFRIVNILNFWNVYDIPNEICDFCFSNSKEIHCLLINMKDKIGKILFDKLYILTKYNKFISFNLSYINDYIKAQIIYICNKSAQNNYLDIFKFTYFYFKDKYKFIFYCDIAIKYSNLNLLKYLYENGCPMNDCSCSIAASSGSLECLKYAYEHGYSLSKDVCSKAVQNKHLECLKYAHKNGCLLDEYLCSISAENKDLECLKYAYENGAYWDFTLYPYSTFSIDILKYAHKSGKLSSNIMIFAGFNIIYLKYLHENNFPWHKDTYSWAIRQGNLDCLKYLDKYGCPRDNEEACNDSIGNLDCLQYLHEIGCPWNEETCKYAIEGDYLDCLIYLHENGCPWAEDTCLIAAELGHLECLIYARKNNCPWNEILCLEKILEESPNIKKRQL